MDIERAGLSLEQVLGVLRRRAPWILLCFVLVAGAAYGFSKHETKKYTATAALSFSNDPLSQQIAGLSSSSSSGVAQQASNIELLRLGDMAAKTATLLGQGLTAENVDESVSVAGLGETSVVDVSATATSPVLAAAIANTYATQFVSEQQSSNHRYFESALAHVTKQLAKLSPQQRVGQDGLDLQDRAQTLRLLTELNYGNVQIAQEALTPASPSSPNTKKNTGLGAVLGLLLGLSLAFLLERLDRRIREPKDLEAIYRVPMLGIVPTSSALSTSARHKGAKTVALPPAEAEAFSLIRAHLRFFNMDREVRTVVIASPAPGDGKSTLALHLAEAATRSGSRVLLLEADLRRPTLAQHLDIQPGPGLAGVLTGAVRMDEATQSVTWPASPEDGLHRRTLDVLPAGAVLPPNPGELLESHAMGSVLAQFTSAYDLVVIDTPPLTAVSDAFPLLTKVDGVIVVGWLGRSRRDDAEQLHHVLTGSGASLLGVIANGSTSGGPSPYTDRGSDNSSAAVAPAVPQSPSSEQELTRATKT
jgi:capsular exopolysaccharide synthesis family protein